MRNCILIILTICISCSSTKTHEQILGAEKAYAFNSFLNSFDSFINSNYSEESESRLKYTRFLKDVAHLFEESENHDLIDPSSKWKIDVSETIRAYNLMESSRMRQEIKLGINDIYPPLYTEEDRLRDLAKPRVYFNDRDSIIQSKRDSLLYRNYHGKYLPMLLDLYPSDKYVKNFVDVEYQHGDNWHPTIVAEGFIGAIEKNMWTNNDALRTVLAVEFYYDLVHLTIKRERKKR